MEQPSRSVSVERKDSYNQDARKDDPSNGNDRDKSGSPSMKRSAERRERNKSPIQAPSGNVLYVGNLNRRLNENEVKEKFEKYGKVLSIQMVRDPYTHESRGYAFIEYANVEDATEALESLDQKEFDGRRMKVERSKRGRGYQKTPGEYLGHFKSNYKQGSPSPYSRRQQRGGGNGGGGQRRRSRDRYSQERSPRGGRPFRNPHQRDRQSRSRSKDRDNQRRYREDHRNRSRSRDRYKDARDNRDSRYGRDTRDTRDTRDARDTRDTRDTRDYRGNRDARDNRDYRDNSYRQGARERN